MLNAGVSNVNPAGIVEMRFLMVADKYNSLNMQFSTIYCIFSETFGSEFMLEFLNNCTLGPFRRFVFSRGTLLVNQVLVDHVLAAYHFSSDAQGIEFSGLNLRPRLMLD